MHRFYKWEATLLLTLFTIPVLSQSRVNKLSLNLLTNLYSYGEGKGHLNNVARLGEGFGFTYKTYDTAKKSGMIYELMTNNTTAYYKNVLGNNAVLEVNDLYANFNFIFPILILHTNRIEHSFGVGIGVGTLMGRDYYDEHNTLLPYNSTTLKKLKFGHYWTSSLLLDYELGLKLYKRVGINFGFRYSTAAPVSSNRADYTISQGTGIGFKYGLFYQFK